MPWKLPQPLESWSARLNTLWNTEVWTRVKFFTFQWSPAAIAPSTQMTYTMSSTGSPDILTNACLGLRIGMGLKLTPPTNVVAAPGISWDCACEANDTLTIWIQNPTGALVTPPAGMWNVKGIVT